MLSALSSQPLYNFYPRPPRGGRPECVGTPCRALQISIHALREEGDRCTCPEAVAAYEFLSTPSARRATYKTVAFNWVKQFLSTPSARRATGSPIVWIVADKFLSTPSARRATRSTRSPRRSHGNFYPRPPRGGRLVRLGLLGIAGEISIHALREEGDSRPCRSA